MPDQEHGGILGRRRRANAPAGEKRTKRYTVKVTPSEQTALEARAAEAGIDVPRLLFEAALAPDVETHAERKQAIAELFALRREVASIANNANQLAKYANTEHRFPKEAEAVLREFRELYPQLSAAVDRLAEP